VNLEGTYQFDAPRDLVWEMLQDPNVLMLTMPGCEELTRIGENQYKGRMQVRIGPVQGLFQGVVELSELDAPESYRLQVSGTGPAGFINGAGKVRLDEGDGSTTMQYEGTAEVGGRLVQVGQRLMESSARAITKQSLDNLAQQIAARSQPSGDAPDADATPPPAPTQSEFAQGVAREMFEDLVPSERRRQYAVTALGAVLTVAVLRVVAEWWAELLAQKIARELEDANSRAQ
jgi:carbon monoxide dehydrogenase subunit G